jgi:hypothetical protein
MSRPAEARRWWRRGHRPPGEGAGELARTQQRGRYIASRGWSGDPGNSGRESICAPRFAQVNRFESRPAVEDIQIPRDWAFLSGIDESLLTMAVTGEQGPMKARAIAILR